MNAPIGNDRLWKQTISGRAFPLTCFSALDIDLYGDVAESLARICRFGGHVPGNAYSVGQHCIVGADIALEESEGDVNLAAYVLLHDAHEAIFGDLNTPVAHWLSAIEHEMFGSANVVRTLIDVAKARIDQAVWRAAGLPPPGRTYRNKVKDYDVRLLATERRHLLMPCDRPWAPEVEKAEPIRMRGKLVAWPVAKVVEAYRERLDQFCPTARRL